MKKLCPQCRGAFEAQFLCPNCGVQLVDTVERSGAIAARGEQDVLPVGMTTRFVAGLIFAQGSYYGMRLIGTSAFLAAGEPDGWATDTGRLMQHAMMLLAALIGGILAGAANPRGLAAGAAVGMLHAFALIGGQVITKKWPDAALLFGGWMVLPFLSAMGGRFGRQLWPPLSDLGDPTPKAASTRAEKPKRATPAERIPIAWFRIIGGAALSIGCTVWAGQIRDYVLRTSGGTFTVDTKVQIQFVTWVISALAIMVGGIFAGAMTRRGFRHGFLVGVLASVGVFIIHQQVIREALPAEEFFASMLRLDDSSGHTPVRMALFLTTNALLIASFGGWVGAALFPRIESGPSKLDRGSI